jgi:hypothetical protein
MTVKRAMGRVIEKAPGGELWWMRTEESRAAFARAAASHLGRLRKETQSDIRDFGGETALTAMALTMAEMPPSSAIVDVQLRWRGLYQVLAYDW